MNLDRIACSLLSFRVWKFLPHIFSSFQNNAVNFSCWLYPYQIGHLHNLRSLFYKIFEIEFFFGDVY